MTIDPDARIARSLDCAALARRLSLYAALGDSFTAGTGCARGEPWPERLARAITIKNPGLEFRNLAAHGATSADVLEQLPEAIELEPDLVTVVCGANDVLRTTRPNANAYARNLSTILARLLHANRGARIVTATAPEHWDFLDVGPRTRARIEAGIARFNRVTRGIAATYEVACLDVARSPGLADPANFAADGLHPSALGHARAAAAFADLIAEQFGKEIDDE